MSFIDIVIIEPCFVQNWNFNPMLCKYVYSFPLAGHYFLTLGLWIFCIMLSTMDIFFNGTDDQL